MGAGKICDKQSFDICIPITERASEIYLLNKKKPPLKWLGSPKYKVAILLDSGEQEAWLIAIASVANRQRASPAGHYGFSPAPRWTRNSWKHLLKPVRQTVKKKIEIKPGFKRTGSAHQKKMLNCSIMEDVIDGTRLDLSAPSFVCFDGATTVRENCEPLPLELGQLSTLWLSIWT